MTGIKTDSGRDNRERVLEALRTHLRGGGYMPTIAKLVTDLGLSRPTFYWHLRSLREQGFVTFEDDDVRVSLRLTRKRGAVE